MRAVSDQDHPVLERWAGMADAQTAVVQDVHLGGRPVCLVGIESRQVPRRGFPPTDGPDTYTAGTLFPQSSKKVARAINGASGNRPLVVLANLSGFDGSPESMRRLQLEYGAEIGRAIVNFRGPIVFCVISRYHGGAFVVFSKTLNPNMTVLALEGSFASVLGGAPAAAVVFSGDVDSRTADDPRVRQLEARLSCSLRAAPRRARRRAGRAARHGARREARRGRGRVRPRAQHPAGRRGGLGGRGDQGLRTAAEGHRGDQPQASGARGDRGSAGGDRLCRGGRGGRGRSRWSRRSAGGTRPRLDAPRTVGTAMQDEHSARSRSRTVDATLRERSQNSAVGPPRSREAMASHVTTGLRPASRRTPRAVRCWAVPPRPPADRRSRRCR